MAPVCGDGSVLDLRRLSGGASRETWSFDLADASGRRRGFVLRRDPGAHGSESDRSTEYHLCEAAAAAGVPVPPVRVLLRPEDDLGRGFVMDRVEGETIARRILRDDAYAAARPRGSASLARSFALATRASRVSGSTSARVNPSPLLRITLIEVWA